MNSARLEEVANSPGVLSHDVELPPVKPAPANGGGLLRLFQSEAFDSHFHMYYLLHRRDQGVHDFLVNLLYKRPDEEIHFYLPQLCQLAIVRHASSSPLPRFLLDKAARSMHLALKSNWIFQATWEDKISHLSEIANKMREEIEMAVVNSKPSQRDAHQDSSTQVQEPPLPERIPQTPDLFLRRRAVQMLNKSRRRHLQPAVEKSLKFLAKRFPSACIRIPPRSVEVTSSPTSPQPAQTTSAGGESGSNSPSMRAETAPLPARKTRKGRIAPGFISTTTSITVPGSKVKLTSVYSKLNNPFNYTSFSRESQSVLLDDSEMQPFIVKQRRCEYFNAVGQFITMLIEASDRIATEPDRNLRLPLVREYLNTLNEWINGRRCIVAASEGIFAMTGLLVPFTHFGVEPESSAAEPERSTPFQTPFLTHPTVAVSETKAHFSSVQILRVSVDQCKVFSSKKRAPYLLVFELADLDEDIYQVAKSHQCVRPKSEQTQTYTLCQDQDELKWEDLYVYSAILQELRNKELFIPPFCFRPLNRHELDKIECGKTICCEVCAPEVDEEIDLEPEEASKEVFAFECPRCKGTRLFYEAMNNDQYVVALRRSLGVHNIARPQRPGQVDAPTSTSESLLIPPYDPPDDSLEDPAPLVDEAWSADDAEPWRLGMSGAGASSRSHSAGRSKEWSDIDSGGARYVRRSSSVGPSPRTRQGNGTGTPIRPSSREETRPPNRSAATRRSAAGSTTLPSLANLIGLGKSANPPKSGGTSKSTQSPASVTVEGDSGGVQTPGGFPELYRDGETSLDQARRVRSLIWPEPWDDIRENIRKSSPYGSLKSWRLGAVFVKGNDDVRQELLASQLVRQFKAIFDEANLRLWLRPYEILVTGSHSGIMEYIPDTQSLDAIKRKFNVDSIHKVFQAAFADNPYEAKRNFIESHAAYSLLGYILQVKDRHNGNLLLDNKGHIVHIDFGFMLSNSPGYVNFETSPFKLSAELMAIMDGDKSENFEYFKELLLRGFLQTRKHYERIVLFVEMMLSASKMPCFAGAPEAALAGLKSRFMQGLDESACINKVLELVDLSVNNWRTAQYDAFQRLTNGIY